MLTDNSQSEFMDFDWAPDFFLDRTTIVYGESGTGKSTIIVHMLKIMKKYAQQVVVFSPTDPQNHAYSCGIVPLPLIHYEVTLEKLDTLWERQSAMAAVYAKANDKGIIESLYRRVPNQRVEVFVQRANAKKAEAIEKIREQFMDEGTVAKKTEEINAKFGEMLTIVYKKAIYEQRDRLRSTHLSEAEKFTIDYLGFNPRIVVIFDDCSAALDEKKIRKSEILKKMFYQNRWVFMTIIIAAHSDKTLNPDIRKNCYLAIFTSKRCAIPFFETRTNSFDTDTIHKAKEAIKCIDEPKRGHRRLAYVRDENKFYVITAQKFPPFEFCPGIVLRYCDQIKSDGTMSIDKSNQFYSHFFASK